MIKNINIKKVRGINMSSDFTNLNILTGGNGVGKTTIIQIIKDIYKGKSKIKEGVVSLTTDTELYNLVKGKIVEGPNLGDKMELVTPGSFLNTKVKGINSTKQEQRETISKLIGIDRNKFFEEAGIDYDLKGLLGELKTINTKEDTYADELVEAQNNLKSLEVVTQPKEIKLAVSNQGELDLLKREYEQLSGTNKELKPFGIKPKPIELIQDRIEQGNENELQLLKGELDQIKNKGLNIKDTCPTCNQKLPDADKVKQSLRDEYIKKQEEIDKFNLVETKTIKGNFEEYQKIQREISDIEAIERSNAEASDYNLELDTKLTELDSKIKSFTLVKGNQEEYESYQSELQSYNTYLNNQTNLNNRVTDLKSKIKELDGKQLEDKIDKYRETEDKFIESIRDKLKIGDLEFKFYKELKSPNAEGDLYASTFEIYYNDKEYTELSGGQQVIVDIVLATLFIKKYGLDFILIDAAEISTDNLKETIKKYCDGLQVICTRIGTGDLSIQNNF